MTEAPFLRMEGIHKEFPGVVANDRVDFSVRRGEIHGLLGENGAGKSTLMKILYGLYSQDEGDIWLDGARLELASPQDAIDAGIGMVHQHFMLIPRLTVTQNVVLGEREPAGVVRDGDRFQRFLPGFLRGDAGPDSDSVLGRASGRLARGLERTGAGLAARFSLGLDAPAERISDLADQYGFDVDPKAKIWQLDVGQQQRVEILKALYRDVDLLILDEPTAVLTPTEAERLFESLERLADEGIGIIFITHKLKEIDAITDRVTVLREGAKVGTVETADVTREDLAEMMVGREVLFDLEKDPVDIGEPVLRARGLRARDQRDIEVLAGVDLTVRSGEVVGIAGVSGNGQKQLAELVAGLGDPTEGTIELKGTDLTGASPREFVDHDVSFVPEDRLRYGCAADLSVMHNATMKDFRQSRFAARSQFLDYGQLREYAETLVETFDIRGVNDVRGVKAGDLSGGNLQKLILAREIHRDPDLLVANQPTRGVDVGAIEFIREAILDQRERGTGVVLISEDLDEIVDLSDRILVIYEGEFVHETTPAEADRERIGLEMTGGAGATDSGADTSDGGEPAREGRGPTLDDGRSAPASRSPSSGDVGRSSHTRTGPEEGDERRSSETRTSPEEGERS